MRMRSCMVLLGFSFLLSFSARSETELANYATEWPSTGTWTSVALHYSSCANHDKWDIKQFVPGEINLVHAIIETVIFDGKNISQTTLDFDEMTSSGFLKQPQRIQFTRSVCADGIGYLSSFEKQTVPPIHGLRLAFAARKIWTDTDYSLVRRESDGRLTAEIAQLPSSARAALKPPVTFPSQPLLRQQELKELARGSLSWQLTDPAHREAWVNVPNKGIVKYLFEEGVLACKQEPILNGAGRIVIHRNINPTITDELTFPMFSLSELYRTEDNKDFKFCENHCIIDSYAPQIPSGSFQQTIPENVDSIYDLNTGQFLKASSQP